MYAHLAVGRCAVGSIVPILHAGNVRHAPLMPVPSVKPVHLENPESGLPVTDDNRAVGIAHVDSLGAVKNIPSHRDVGSPGVLGIAAPAGSVRALAGIV